VAHTVDDLGAIEKAREISLAGFLNNPGGFLLSHTVARAVPSAPRGLTSVFGMGTGVALSTQPPENFFERTILVLELSNLKNENQSTKCKFFR
jgi:hypothetical protein